MKAVLRALAANVSRDQAGRERPETEPIEAGNEEPPLRRR
jgi:hypothetical protein